MYNVASGAMIAQTLFFSEDKKCNYDKNVKGYHWLGRKNALIIFSLN